MWEISAYRKGVEKTYSVDKESTKSHIVRILLKCGYMVEVSHIQA